MQLSSLSLPTRDDINKVIMQSSLMRLPTHDDISKLIQSREILYKSKDIGCCKRNFLKFEEDDHLYAYNHNKTISNILKKKVSTYLYNSMKQNSKIKINNSIVIDDMISPDENNDNKYGTKNTIK